MTWPSSQAGIWTQVCSFLVPMGPPHQDFGGGAKLSLTPRIQRRPGTAWSKLGSSAYWGWVSLGVSQSDCWEKVWEDRAE